MNSTTRRNDKAECAYCKEAFLSLDHSEDECIPPTINIREALADLIEKNAGRRIYS